MKEICSMSQSTVLILGAQGRLGSALVEAFAAKGWRVVAQSRRPGATAAATAITCDLRDVQQVVKSARGGPVDVVIHAANVVYTRWATEAQPMNDAAISIATLLGATLMLPGNVYNFGTSMPELLLSNTPQLARTSKGLIRIAMEQALAKASAQGTQTIVIRAGDFFGSGVGSWFDQAIARDLPKGKLTYPGPLGLVHAWAYVPDLAATFVRVAEARLSLAAMTTVMFAGHAVTGDELVRTVRGIAPHPLKVGGMPWWLIRAVGVVKPLWRDLAEMSYLWQRPHRLVADGAHSHLIAAATPLNIALHHSLAALHPNTPFRASIAPIASAV
jgi:nucleoside-diphosphate-sugar epimerase